MATPLHSNAMNKNFSLFGKIEGQTFRFLLFTYDRVCNIMARNDIIVSFLGSKLIRIGVSEVKLGVSK